MSSSTATVLSTELLIFHVTEGEQFDLDDVQLTTEAESTEYHWSGWSLTSEERSPSNVRTYVGTLAHFDGTSSTLGTPAFYTHDHLGSTRGLYDASEASLGTREHTPYGATYLDALGPAAAPVGFTGHRLDALTGDYYAPYRYYSPTLARWLKRDPLGMVDGSNMYVYVGGNPVSFLDSLGLEIEVGWHKVLGSRWYHTSIRITPENQKRWANTAFFKDNVDGNGDHFATISAHRDRGNLTAQINRGTDLSDQEGYVSVDLPSICEDEDEFIKDLFDRTYRYRNKLDYDVMPSNDGKWWIPDGADGYNSNSFTAGLLGTTGATPPSIRVNAPGYSKPVPSSYFWGL